MRLTVGALVTAGEASVGSASYYLCRPGKWSGIALRNISFKLKITRLSQQLSCFWKFSVRGDNRIRFGTKLFLKTRVTLLQSKLI